MAARFNAIDCWINPNPPVSEDEIGSDWNVGYLFNDWLERRRRGTTLDQLIDEMNEAGVEKGVLCAGYGTGDGDLDWVSKAIERYPERFVGSVVVDPRSGMDAVRALDRLAKDQGFKMARVLAFATRLPYDHAFYYPIYAKCVELGMILGCNVGIPGPRRPGKHQDPLALDEICWFFPELKIIMQHGGEPWEQLCVKLMLKWPNLYYMTSAFTPKHIPKAIIDYINTRGADKIMWATDYPLLPFDRSMEEIAELPFRDEERRHKFLYANAERLFFSNA